MTDDQRGIATDHDIVRRVILPQIISLLLIAFISNEKVGQRKCLAMRRAVKPLTLSLQGLFRSKLHLLRLAALNPALCLLLILCFFHLGCLSFW